MKISEVILLDFRIKGNRKLVIDMVAKLPFFNDIEVNVNTLEIAISKMSNKYPIMLGYIMKGQDGRYWSAMIKESKEHNWIKTIYGESIFEIFLKTTLFMYVYINKVIKKENPNG